MTKLNFSQIPEDIKTTSFHLNETMHFNQNDLFWYKTMSFWPTQKQKKGC
jgi:hypothetical protein